MTTRTPTQLDEYVQVARSAAKKAGAKLLEMRQADTLSVQFKSDRNPVTNADTTSETIILSHIRSHFPEHLFCAEESSPHYQSLEDFRGPVWIIDPLDGTVNYTHGLSQSSVSIAFAYDGEVLAGVVYSPFLGELFSAVKGGGAFLNDVPITASRISDLKYALVTTGFPYQRSELDEILSRLRSVLSHCQDVRRLGSAALDISYVACGRIEAFYESLQPWDIAAACLIASEAGARIGQYGDSPLTSLLPAGLNGDQLLVANSLIFEHMKTILK